VSRKACISFTWIIVALFVALVTAGFRFWNLGDLSVARKIIESAIWFFLVFVMFGVIFYVFEMLAVNKNYELPSYRRYEEKPFESASPDDLMRIESEIPEAENPELTGIKSKPPEELAEALRGLSEQNEK